MPEWYNEPWLQEIWKTTYMRLPTLGIALGILVGGTLVAYIIRAGIYAALKRTTVDNKIAALFGVRVTGDHQVERTVAKFVYYILLAFVFVAFFGYLRIEAVTRPLLTLLDGLAAAVPNLVKAVLLGFGGFLLAKGVRKLILTLLEKLRFERRMSKLMGEEPKAAGVEAKAERTAVEAAPKKAEVTSKKAAAEGAPKKKVKKVIVEQPISTTVADIAYWVTLAVVAIPVLEALQIGVLAAPLSSALATVTTYLPKVAGAAILLIAGYVVARLVRAVVSGALEKIGLDRAISRLGFGAVVREQSLSRIIGSIVMVFVLLQFAVSAVGRLELAEISDPLSMMLTRIYAYLPKVFMGLVLMAAGVLIARITGNLASRLLAAMGLNTLMVHIGLYREVSDDAKKQEEESKKLVDESLRRIEGEESSASEDADEILTSHGTSGIRTPADIAGAILGAVVVLLFLRQTLGTMNLHGLAEMLDSLLGYLPQVLVAVLVVGAGLWAGRWVRSRIDDLTRRSTDRTVRALGLVAYIVVVAFSVMIALQQLGVGQQLIAIAFSLVLGAVCLALALAFGLGGRDVAGKIVQKEYDRHSKTTSMRG